MGTWGTKLFSNDTTCDVRDTYIELLKNQYSDKDAEQKTYEEYEELIGTDEEPLFWLALAHTQWKNGRLSLEVREKAFAWIEVNGGADLFEEDKKIYERWIKYLVELKEMLLSQMPPRKVYRKPVEFERNPWNLGDVYAYQFHTDIAEQRGLLNKFIVFHKIGDIEYFKGEVYTIVQVYDKIFNEVPKLKDIADVRILPLVEPPSSNETIDDYIPSFEYYLRSMMNFWNKRSYPVKHLIFIGNMYVPKIEYKYNMISELAWDRDKMDEWLSDYYLGWQGIEY